jgi:sugar lactone lactonase YvrE
MRVSMISLKAELFCASGCILGEGPFWHEERVWCVDTEGGLLLSITPAGTICSRVSLDKRIGAAVPIGSRELLLAVENEIVQIAVESGTRQTIARLNDMPEDNRFNDGKVDPRGRFLIGTMNTKGKKGTAALYSLQDDRSLKKLKENLSVSNGLAWSASGTTMYLIDTPEKHVLSYDYDLETGDISGEHVVLDLSDVEGMPDGMTIDTEGRLWIGFWGGWAVRCYEPKRQECLAVVPLPCANVTSCCFGGPQRNRLFITTAAQGLNEKEKKEQVLAGNLFVCDPQATGQPARLCRLSRPSSGS